MGYDITTDCQSVSANATGLPTGVSMTFSNNTVNIIGTTTAGSSGTYNYAVVLQNTSASSSHTIAGTITVNASSTTSSSTADTTPPVITLTGSSTINSYRWRYLHRPRSNSY